MVPAWFQNRKLGLEPNSLGSAYSLDIHAMNIS